ncbi:hypothetical protein ACWEPN_16950 [Nonomuraea wenchangensis]
MGEAQAARRLLGETEELIRAASEHPEDEPPWMYSYDDGWFDMQRRPYGSSIAAWRLCPARTGTWLHTVRPQSGERIHDALSAEPRPGLTT